MNYQLKLSKMVKKRGYNPIELFKGIDDIYRVNLVCQNEEMSR